MKTHTHTKQTKHKQASNIGQQQNNQASNQINGSTSKAFHIRRGVNQGCVLAPTLFGIFFAPLLKHAFGSSTEGMYLHTRSDGKLFNLA